MKLNKENVKEFLKKKGEEIKRWIAKHPVESVECAASVLGITFMTIEGIKTTRSNKACYKEYYEERAKKSEEYAKKAEESNESVVDSLKQIADNTRYRG
jgi:hypothetical protein